MNVVVVGLGSMGRRRSRLLKQISDDFVITGVDAREDRRKQAENELFISTEANLDKVLNDIKPDCVIVSTAPLSHCTIIEKCLKSGCNVFTEINLVDDGYESNTTLAKEMGKTLFLSSTPIYKEEIRYIHRRLSTLTGRVNYNYHVGQYLPDWHPWETVNDYFVGDIRTNGCRELLAIELPWMIRLFGDIASCEVMGSRNTHLPIEYKDNYLLAIQHANGNKGVLAVDVVSRKAVRNLEIYGEEIYLTWDGTPDGLRDYDVDNKTERAVKLYDEVDRQEGYASFVVENGYRRELETFLDTVKGKAEPLYSFEEDSKVLKLIDHIEALADVKMAGKTI